MEDSGKTEKRALRFVDLCAGLGGFHRAFQLAELGIGASQKVGAENLPIEFTCVLACDINPELRELYVRNFPELEATYRKLFPPDKASTIEAGLYDSEGKLQRIHGDLGRLVSRQKRPRCLVPKHDILCAGFPCQPFSKSGAQKGFDDFRGTVFGHIASIIQEKMPTFVILENVGNFERHDGGNTWLRVKSFLENQNYEVSATTHVLSSNLSTGLLSPHHIGFPHHRERFFIIATKQNSKVVRAFKPSTEPFPTHFRHSDDPRGAQNWTNERAGTALKKILQEGEAIATEVELRTAILPLGRTKCIDHWNELLSMIHAHYESWGGESDSLIGLMPSFPIWGFELDPWRWYPEIENPKKLIDDQKGLRKAWSQRLRRAKSTGLPPPLGDTWLASERPSLNDLNSWVNSWPAYATREEWPQWKQRFINQNRAFAQRLIDGMDKRALRRWLDGLQSFSPSLQKLEWNCRGGALNLYSHILQFRPSGLRAKRLQHVPALVAMTATQIPIVPIQTEKARRITGNAKARFLMPREALLLQGFPVDWHFPDTRSASYQAFGNAVNVHLVKEIVLKWLSPNTPSIWKTVFDKKISVSESIPA